MVEKRVKTPKAKAGPKRVKFEMEKFHYQEALSPLVTAAYITKKPLNFSNIYSSSPNPNYNNGEVRC